jgi:oligopeptidase A
MPRHRDNPLLGAHRLPPFSRIRPEHVVPAIDTVLDDCRGDVAGIVASGATDWEDLAASMEAVDERLGRTWSPVNHLRAVADEPALREAVNVCLPKLSEYATEIGQNATLYRAYETLEASADAAGLDGAQRTIVKNTLREFRLAGVALPAAEQARFKALSARLAELSSRFEENVLDATQAWRHRIEDESALSGLPQSARTLAAETARREGVDGWLLTLEFPSYFPVITYADDQRLRRAAYEAYTTRASERGPHAGRWDNTAVMEEILALRHEKAQLLGYSSFAELSLARKMAASTTGVTEFLEDLARRARPIAEGELAALREFAHREHGCEELQAWDIPYYSEKLRVQRFDLSQEALRPYFPIPRVLEGMFEVARRLYGLEIRAVDKVDTWHPDVRFFRIRDADGEVRGEFYLDLYARPHKRGGAWMDECLSRRRVGNRVQTPVAYLTCNFIPPAGRRPALLTHDEVTTLFHEFGHGLHHMLTRVDYPSVAGIRGVPWDAVELPSQLMENWCWEREALAVISGHHETGEPLPDEVYERLRAAKNFQSGMQMLRQVEFALFDFRLHLDYDPGAGACIQQTLDAVRREVAVVHPPDFNRFAHAFSHIFGGSYAAGYYSYKWAETLSSDAFALFEEKGIFDRETGLGFLRAILEQGGARDAMELFVAFRGREPTIEALLRHSGIGPPEEHAEVEA